MIDFSTLPLLKDKKALVTGVANDQSIAWVSRSLMAACSERRLSLKNAKTEIRPLAPGEHTKQEPQADGDGHS